MRASVHQSLIYTGYLKLDVNISFHGIGCRSVVEHVRYLIFKFGDHCMVLSKGNELCHYPKTGETSGSLLHEEGSPVNVITSKLTTLFRHAAASTRALVTAPNIKI